MKGQARSATPGRQVSKCFLAVSAILLASAAHAQQWPRFRGPNGQGISHAKTIPTKWTQNDYNWKVTLPGGGHSSPVIWADRVFVTCADQKAARGVLLALRTSDGEALWQEQYQLTSYRMNRLNSYSATTPALDAQHVYVLWPTKDRTLLTALDHDGNEIWKRTFSGYKCQHGPGSSPIVLDDIVVFTLEHEDTTDSSAKGAWVAVDRTTGQTRWELPRKTGPKTSYSTPCAYPSGDDASLLIFTSFSHNKSANYSK